MARVGAMVSVLLMHVSECLVQVWSHVFPPLHVFGNFDVLVSVMEQR